MAESADSELVYQECICTGDTFNQGKQQGWRGVTDGPLAKDTDTAWTKKIVPGASAGQVYGLWLNPTTGSVRVTGEKAPRFLRFMDTEAVRLWQARDHAYQVIKDSARKAKRETEDSTDKACKVLAWQYKRLRTFAERRAFLAYVLDQVTGGRD